jgi:hypothetical protein
VTDIHSAQVFHVREGTLDPDGEPLAKGWYVHTVDGDGNDLIGGPFPTEEIAVKSWVLLATSGALNETKEVTKH